MVDSDFCFSIDASVVLHFSLPLIPCAPPFAAFTVWFLSIIYFSNSEIIFHIIPSLPSLRQDFLRRA